MAETTDINDRHLVLTCKSMCLIHGSKSGIPKVALALMDLLSPIPKLWGVCKSPLSLTKLAKDRTAQCRVTKWQRQKMWAMPFICPRCLFLVGASIMAKLPVFELRNPPADLKEIIQPF